jgi:hypothetical protein
MSDHGAKCPACGGAGGGPFGRPGSAWDVETYVCPRCQGLGVVSNDVAVRHSLAKAADPAIDGAVRGPGIADTRPRIEERVKRRSST